MFIQSRRVYILLCIDIRGCNNKHKIEQRTQNTTTKVSYCYMQQRGCVSQHIAETKKPDTKEYIHYDLMCTNEIQNR